MKKFLSLAVVAAALCASVGCEDKKTSAPAKAVSPAAPVTTSPAK